MKKCCYDIENLCLYSQEGLEPNGLTCVKCLAEKNKVVKHAYEMANENIKQLAKSNSRFTEENRAVDRACKRYSEKIKELAIRLEEAEQKLSQRNKQIADLKHRLSN